MNRPDLAQFAEMLACMHLREAKLNESVFRRGQARWHRECAANLLALQNMVVELGANK